MTSPAVADLVPATDVVDGTPASGAGGLPRSARSRGTGRSGRAGRSARSRRVAALGLVVALMVLAAACGQSNTPQTYDAVTQNNFIQGCTGASTGASTTTTLASTDLCQCMYTVTTGAIPMSSQDQKERGGGKTFATYTGKTFQQINDELKSNPHAVPADLQAAWAKSCARQGYPAVTTTTRGSSGGPTTTVKSSSSGGPTTTKG